ncbi:hypothetical protein C1646_773350 [Rhizophagus diaphanus]|nr:hypothetical protein C1646_773350 [Rhizophagus diaphanus] [Rhizophagus sp. MUCL 43196]
MNDNKLLPNLSQNLLEILNDDEFYDITIEVGIDPYVRVFRAHMVILYYRSSYLRRILSTNKKKDDETLTHIKLSNISPEIFEIILRYIYGGKISLNDYDNSDIIKVMVAANELNLQELVTYLQSFLIENKKSWMEENFNFVYKTSFENNSLSELQNYCTDLITEEPDKIFKSPDFTSIPENLLISIVKNDNLKTSEVHIWEHVLKWGFAQNPELPSEIANFSNDDLNTLKNTLKQCIPFIRFYDLTSKEFVDKVFPYREILPKELCAYLLETFLTLSNPESRGIERNDHGGNDKLEHKCDTDWKSFRMSEEKYDNHHNSVRKYDIRPSTESKAENSNNIRTLTTNTYTFLPMRKILEFKPRSSAAIPNENVGSRPSKQNPFGEARPIDIDFTDKLTSSYESHDGRSQIKFHEIYAYPSTTKDGFIFCFNSDRINNYFLSRAVNKNNATYNNSLCNPIFDRRDLIIWKVLISTNYYKKSSYEKSIRKTTKKHSEDINTK